VSICQEITALRKAGRLDEAWVLAKPALAETPDDLWLKRAAGWLFHALIKREIAAFDAEKISHTQLITNCGGWLRNYARTGKFDRPGLLHSQLLTQVLKVKEWPKFLAFAHWWWDPHSFLPEDREPVTLDNGKTLDSLELRFVYAVGRAITSDSDQQDPSLIAWGADLLNTTLAKHPNNQWLHYYQSKRLSDLGQTAEARRHLLPVLRRQRGASWAWALFGRTWETDDPDKAITSYFHAIQVARKDEEILKIRVRLAALLAKMERYAEAAVQVRAALVYRERHGYRIPQNLAVLAAADWYQRYSQLPNLTREPDVAQAAEALLFEVQAADLHYRLGVIDNQNPDKALAHVCFGMDDGVILPYRSMKGVAKLAVGVCIEVGFVKGEPRPVTYRHSDDQQIPGLYEHFEGEWSQRPDQAFAFIITDDNQRIFVHPILASAVNALIGHRVSCRAVVSRNNKGKPGWRALLVDDPLEGSGCFDTASPQAADQSSASRCTSSQPL
jgi:hypothetical protein